MTEPCVEAPVVICEVLTSRTFRGTLPNGKRVLAYFESSTPRLDLAAGDRVMAMLSLADFSRCVIVRRADV